MILCGLSYLGGLGDPDLGLGDLNMDLGDLGILGDLGHLGDLGGLRYLFLCSVWLFWVICVIVGTCLT